MGGNSVGVRYRYGHRLKSRVKCRYEEVRLEPWLADEVRSLAESSGVSVNQLVEGVLAWAVEKGHPGLPSPTDDRVVAFDSSEERGAWFGETGLDQEGRPIGGGDVLFVLDFSARRAVLSRKEFLGI